MTDSVSFRREASSNEVPRRDKRFPHGSKMIGKSTTGNDFYGCVRYALDEENGLKQAHIIGGNTIGSSAAELSAEFAQNQRAKPHIKKPVWHIALSSPIHEQLSDAQWQQVAIAYLDCMECDRSNHQYVVIRHHDEPQGHVHIVANRIGEDGSVHHLRWDRLKTIQATQALEEKFNFLSAKPGKVSVCKFSPPFQTSD